MTSSGDIERDEDLEPFWTYLAEANAKALEQKRLLHSALKQAYDPARELTTEQIDLLIRWADTLHYYRQLPFELQEQLRVNLIRYEGQVHEALGKDTVLEGVLNWARRNSSEETHGEATAEGKKLLSGSVATDYIFAVMANTIDKARFGYQFHLKRGAQNYNLFIFLRNGQPLTLDSLDAIMDLEMHPTSVIDLPGNRPLKPFKIYQTV